MHPILQPFSSTATKSNYNQNCSDSLTRSTMKRFLLFSLLLSFSVSTLFAEKFRPVPSSKVNKTSDIFIHKNSNSTLNTSGISYLYNSSNDTRRPSIFKPKNKVSSVRVQANSQGNSINSKLSPSIINFMPPCDLEDANLFDVVCNNNNSPYNPSDDYTTFYLNPSGVFLGSFYTVTVSSGTITPSQGIYGVPTKFTLQNGSASAGNITVSLTDNLDNLCTHDVLVTAPGSCSPCDLNTKYAICPGESYTLSISGTLTAIQWFRNGIAIPGANSPSYIANQIGTYSFTGTDGGNCPTSQCCPTIIEEGKCIFDLALYKKLKIGQDSILAPGSLVTFTVYVINQGNIAADNIQVTDYIPSELTLNDADWTAAVGGKTTIVLNSGQELPAGGLLPGQTISVDITFTLNSPLAAGIKITNWSEISAATDDLGVVRTDTDSDPDNTLLNDLYLVDNDIDGNVKNQGSDEDDHDPAFIYTQAFDLALAKALSNGQSPMVNPGDNVNFTITVTNQGDIAANNIQITDYIPVGFTLNDGDWTASGSNATIVLNSGQELPAGGLLPTATVSVDITLRVANPLPANTKLVNWAEISATTDANGNPVVDIDSTPDQNNTDKYLVDNEVNGNGKNGGDEDDHDPAEVVVNPFDLALVKKLANGQSSMIQPGQAVNYTITVTNQGLIPANNIVVTDYIPVGMTLTDPDWTPAGPNATLTLNSGQELPVGGLLPGSSVSVEITLTANAPLPANTKLVNWAEISSAQDNNGVPQVDIDSTPDGNNTDTYLTDNDINGNGKTGGDEDDHDPAEVVVNPFDLALYKRLANGQPSMINPGDNVNFTITVVNQGLIAANNVSLIDYIPVGFTLADADWTASGSNATLLLNIGGELGAGGLLPGDSVKVDITLQASGVLASNTKLVNWSEINSTTDANGNPVVDVDSTPDAIRTNDGYLSDNEINGNGKNGGDEDDHDPAEVVVKPFDLALVKKLAPGQNPNVQPGSQATFRITVTNQGMITANDIRIIDYIPPQLTLTDPDWAILGSDATILLNAGQELPVGGLVPGASVDVDITFTVVAPLVANTKIINWAEISSATDMNGNSVPDVDSTPDGNNTDTYLADNDINGDGKNGGDEDDHDPAELVVQAFDLALVKRLAPGQNPIVNPGDNVNFRISVINQGTIAANNITVTDYIPSQMTLNDADWTAAGANATILLNIGQELPVGGLLPGDSVIVDITLRVNSPLPANQKITNWAEISSTSDANGNPVVDVDSTPDGSNGDKYLVDNDINGDGKNGGDEDDHDPADVFTNVFDLALYKVLAPGQSVFIEPGDDVNFRIYVVNQGGIAANNVVITDYIPSEMTLNDADWTTAVAGKTTITLNIGQELPAGGLLPGQSVFVDITLKANSPLSPNTEITNWSEITSATDNNNNPQTDIDSNPDNVNNDLLLVDNDINGNGKNGGDEDDHDLAKVITKVFDLALYKKLAPGQSYVIEPGDDVNFRITVVNQGTIAANNIIVTDYIPTQMTLNDADWTAAGVNATITLNVGQELPVGGLLPGDSIQVDITLKAASPLAANLTIRNWAEISGATDDQNNPQVDVDSTPDGNNTDKFLVDNDINGNGKNGGDEDDHDPADVITATFDVAMVKRLAPGQNELIEPGDLVTFRITVTNQGTINADYITLIDYIPAEMTLADPDWTAGLGNTATLVLDKNQELPSTGLIPGQVSTLT